MRRGGQRKIDSICGGAAEPSCRDLPLAFEWHESTGGEAPARRQALQLLLALQVGCGAGVQLHAPRQAIGAHAASGVDGVALEVG